jgi:hypothetical protein
MLEADARACEDGNERFLESTGPGDAVGDKAAWDARRRIERLRELRRLRELLDDPSFNELD